MSLAREHRKKRRGESPGAGERSSPALTRAPLATVAMVAAAARVPPNVVRYYTRIGLLKPRRDPDNGYKLFDAAHITRLRFVRQAQTLGLTLGEIRMILRDAERGETPCPRVRDIMRRRIAENRRLIRAQKALQRRIETAMRAWEHMPDRIPTGNSVCYLIESVGDARK